MTDQQDIIRYVRNLERKIKLLEKEITKAEESGNNGPFPRLDSIVTRLQYGSKRGIHLRRAKGELAKMKDERRYAEIAINFDMED